MERLTELNGEEKREEGDKGDQEEKRGNKKRREQASQYTSLCALHSLDPSERFTELHREEKREEGAKRIKGGIKRRETDPASNQFPKYSPQPGIHKEIHTVG